MLGVKESTKCVQTIREGRDGCVKCAPASGDKKGGGSASSSDILEKMSHCGKCAAVNGRIFTMVTNMCRLKQLFSPIPS